MTTMMTDDHGAGVLAAFICVCCLAPSSLDGKQLSRTSSLLSGVDSALVNIYGDGDEDVDRNANKRAASWAEGLGDLGSLSLTPDVQRGKSSEGRSPPQSTRNRAKDPESLAGEREAMRKAMLSKFSLPSAQTTTTTSMASAAPAVPVTSQSGGQQGVGDSLKAAMSVAKLVKFSLPMTQSNTQGLSAGQLQDAGSDQDATSHPRTDHAVAAGQKVDDDVKSAAKQRLAVMHARVRAYGTSQEGAAMRANGKAQPEAAAEQMEQGAMGSSGDLDGDAVQDHLFDIATKHSDAVSYLDSRCVLFAQMLSDGKELYAYTHINAAAHVYAKVNVCIHTHTNCSACTGSSATFQLCCKGT